MSESNKCCEACLSGDCFGVNCPCHSQGGGADASAVKFGDMTNLKIEVGGNGGHSTTPSWEAEFDDLFPRLSVSTMNADKLGWNLVHRTPEVKAFIQSLLDHQQAEAVAIVEDYGKRMSELHEEMIATSHEDSKMMLAYDMHSRLIAVKHIKEKMLKLSTKK